VTEHTTHETPPQAGSGPDPVEPAPAAPQHVPGAGEKLKAARMEKGLELGPIAARLRLKKDQLEALEADNYEPFPAIAYALGFLRSYAAFLGVDVSAEIQALKAQNEPKLHPATLDFPEAPEHKGSFSLTPILIGLVLLGAGYGVWSWYDQPAQPTEPVANAPLSPEAPMGGTPAPVAPQADAPQPEASVSDAGPIDAVPEPALPEELAQSPVRGGGDSAMAATMPATEDPGAVMEPEAEPTSTPAPPVAAAREGLITFTALEDSWIQIKSPAGRIVKTGVLSQGETYTLPERQGLTMITGNAGGLSVQLGETMLGVIGKPGEIKQDVSLDAESLKAMVNATQ